MLLRSGNNVFQPFQLVAVFFAVNKAFFNHMRFGCFVKLVAAQFAHIMLVNPVQFVNIKYSRVLGNMVHAELFNKLVHAENFLFAVRRPAKKCQEVVNGFRQITELAVLVYGSCTVAFGHFGMVLAENKGNMPEGRLLKAKCVINKALARSVGKMFLSADNMGDMH